MSYIFSYITILFLFQCVSSAPNIESEIQSTVQQKTAEILKDISSQFQSSVSKHGQNNDPLHQIIGQQISDGMKGQFAYMPNHNLNIGMRIPQPQQPMPQSPFPRTNFAPEQILREQQPNRPIPLPLEMQRFHSSPLQQMLQDHLSPDQIVSELVREEQSRHPDSNPPQGFPIQSPFIPQTNQHPGSGLNLPQPFPQQGVKNPNFQNPQPQGQFPPLMQPPQQPQIRIQMPLPANPIQQQQPLPPLTQHLPSSSKPDTQIIQQIQNQISEILQHQQHPKLIPEHYSQLQDIRSQLSAILQQANGNGQQPHNPDSAFTQPTHLPGPDFLSDLPDIVHALSKLLLEDLQTPQVPETKLPPALPQIQPKMIEEQQSLLQNIRDQLSELFRHNLQSAPLLLPGLEHVDPKHTSFQPPVNHGVKESQGSREEDKKLGLHILHQQIEEEEAKIQRKQDQEKQNHDHDWIIPKQKSGHRKNYAVYPNYDGE